MGNSEPQNSKLKVYIETQKKFYNSGSTINGAVFIDADANFQFDALFIRLQGDEFCQWFQGSSKNRRKYVGNQNFYTQEHILCKYSSGVVKGKYLYPFSMEISQNIPGSFQSEIYDARIKYNLIAYFANFNNADKRNRFQSTLIIREPFRQEICQYEGRVPSEKNNDEDRQPILFCCSQKGSLIMEAHFMRNVCFEEENVPIVVSINNQLGKTDVKRIVVNLVQYTFVSANNGADRTYTKIVDTQYINTKIPKGTKLQNLKLDFQIKGSKNLAQTAISTLVANYYRLEVEPQIVSALSYHLRIYSPLFIMKKDYKCGKTPRWTNMINENDFQNKQKMQIFHAPQYWFRKNRNLQIMNFKLEDNILSQSQHFI